MLESFANQPLDKQLVLNGFKICECIVTNPDQLTPTTYRAAWIIPCDREPIADGVLTQRGGLIESVVPYRSHDHQQGPLIDLGDDAAIIPGLVNAHTHFEFSDLQQPLGHPGIEFTDWVREIVATRHQNAHDETETRDAIHSGLQESFNAGVWCVGDIATAPVSQQQYTHQSTDSVRKIVFLEQLGSQFADSQPRRSQLELFLTELAPHSQLQAAISPHAPYSVHPQLLDWLCRQAIQARLPVAMHVAETEAERELLDSQTGPFVDLLKDFGVWNPARFEQLQTILDILKTLSQAPQSLVIHGNYLTDDEIAFIASTSDSMSVVFCPRTHQYFGHADYPLRQLLGAGVQVAVGTDSRASNPDLNLFSELQNIHQRFPGLNPEQIIKLGTINGATALGVEQQLGTLTPGKQAAITVVRVPNAAPPTQSPYSWLLSETATAQSINNCNNRLEFM